MRSANIFIALLAASCAGSNAQATEALATRLANGRGSESIKCGIRLLANVPSTQINAALRSPDGPGVLDSLGPVVMDEYEAQCVGAKLLTSGTAK
jgi:hypothetical protein